MRTFDVYEDFINIIGEHEHKRIGAVEAKTLKSAVNKAKKQFKCDEWRRPYREGRRMLVGISESIRF